MKNTSTKANFAELYVATMAAEKGYYVGFMPQQCPYDMVIDRGNGPQRVQVKYKSLSEEGTCYIKLNPKYNKNNHTVYSSKNIDALVVFEPESKRVAWVPIKEVEHKNMFCIRVKKAKGGPTSKSMLFEDYEIW